MFPGTPDLATVDALRPGTPPTQKYNDFMDNCLVLSEEITLIPGIGATYGQRLNDNADIDTVSEKNRLGLFTAGLLNHKHKYIHCI